MFTKYQMEIVDTKTLSYKNVNSYYDLNNDGISEEILLQQSETSHTSIIIRTNEKIIDQWNFKGSIINPNLIFCDYNNDSIVELFIFTIKNDSIFVHGINPFEKKQTNFLKIFIDISMSYDGKYYCGVPFHNAYDIDQDGSKDLVFEIMSGITKQPRNLYKLNIKNKSVVKSPKSGTAVSLPICFDINNDGYNEYLGRSMAYGNIHPQDSLNYPDTCTWLMVIDKNMNFLFEPKPFGQYKTRLFSVPFKPKNNCFIASLQTHQGTENVDNKLILFNNKGEIIKERLLSGLTGIKNSFLLSRDNRIFNDLFLVLSNGQILQIDSNLNTINTLSIPKISYLKPTRIDLDEGGICEFIFLSEDRRKIIVTRNDFSFPVVINLESELTNEPFFSLKENSNEKPLLCTQFGKKAFQIQYSKNPLFLLKYLIWLGIYGAIFIFLFLLQKVQQSIARTKFETEHKIAELQLKSLKGQTDPHFTLNLLSSIGNLYYNRDNEKAAYVFGKYAKLLRTTILSSDNISVSLESELEYVSTYMDLEKFRFDDNFTYNIDIENNIETQTEIPKMLIHTFVENAIKHGLKHKKEKGKLDISVHKHAKSIIIKIKDNGVGREKAKEYSRLSTGKGLHILDNLLDLYLDLKKIKIKYKIVDLVTPLGQVEGTEAVVEIPIKIKK
jgi:hypothetical protein